MPRSTVGGILRWPGLNRLPPLQPPVPVRRYERARAGELLHVDTKSLGRIARIRHRIHGDRRTRVRGIGWEHVHVGIDDATRLAYVEVRPSLQTADVVGFLERAVIWFAAQGVRAERVMTDNGSAYLSHRFAAACHRLGPGHLRTRPYTPRTNGKAERFIRTLLREWAYRGLSIIGAAPAGAGTVAALLQPPPAPHESQLRGPAHSAPGARGMNNVFSFHS